MKSLVETIYESIAFSMIPEGILDGNFVDNATSKVQDLTVFRDNVNDVRQFIIDTISKDYHGKKSIPIPAKSGITDKRSKELLSTIYIFDLGQEYQNKTDLDKCMKAMCKYVGDFIQKHYDGYQAVSFIIPREIQIRVTDSNNVVYPICKIEPNIVVDPRRRTKITCKSFTVAMVEQKIDKI